MTEHGKNMIEAMIMIEIGAADQMTKQERENFLEYVHDLEKLCEELVPKWRHIVGVE